MNFPTRIVCLTEEPTEWLYRLNQQDRIVGISGFTVRPKIARKEKPKVSLFTSAKVDEILALEPDLVIGYSDIQADIAKELIAQGVSVFISNHRSVDEIFSYLEFIGKMVDDTKTSLKILDEVRNNIQRKNESIVQFPIRPKVYFEEWFDPIITSIQWVKELIELAGGEYIFPDLSEKKLAKDRIIQTDEVIEKNPDIILVSWCGKGFKKQRMLDRPGWKNIQAIKDDQIFELPSPIILQPGIAAITEGFDRIFEIFYNWCVQRN